MQNTLAKEVEDAVLHLDVCAIVLNEDWLDSPQADKGALLEMEQLCPVCGSSLWVDNQGWLSAFFTFDLAVFYLIQHLLFVIFARSVDIEAASRGCNRPDNEKVAKRSFGYMTWWLSDHVHEDVTE